MVRECGFGALERFPGRLNRGVFSCRREYDSSFVLGGGQHGMPKPYSEDLRARVIGAIEAGATRPEVADQYSVSLSSVGRFVRLDRETGSVSAAKFGGYKEFALPAHEVLVRQLVAEQPDVTLAERVNAPFVLEGPMTGEMFKAYVEQFLAPTLKRGYIVFMDNASVHKGEGIEEAVAARGATLFY